MVIISAKREVGQDPGIPIIGDIARLDPRLGFESYVAALADAIRGGSPAQYTIGIYGPWGSGKSSLLNGIAEKLSQDQKVIPVVFDAWRYENASHIIVPLLHAIYAKTQNPQSSDICDKVRVALLAVLRGITISFGPLSISGSTVLASSPAEEITRLDEAFAKPYAEMRAIGQALGDRRLAVMIDDLDRCSPEKVVSLLESINLVMDVPGFVFVLALDYDVLAQAIALRYPHVSGHVFIEKMIQVPFRVPRLELPKESFLYELIPDWAQRVSALPGLEEAVYDVATLGLQANPRQIKRLVNSLLVVMRIAEDRRLNVNTRLLTGMVGVQVRWPAEYRDFIDGVLANDPNPFAPLMREDEVDLRRYADHFFIESMTAVELRPYLQLTQSVSIPSLEDQESESVSAISARELSKDKLARELLEAGYETGANPDVYSHARNPDFRIKFGKTVVRFEIKDTVSGGRNWQLGFSMALTNHNDTALVSFARSPRLMVDTTFSEYAKPRKVPASLLMDLKSRNADFDA